MTNQPKVSVIVPVYNTARFLRDCLDSLLNQTFPASDYEVVAVNDGSTDESLAILRSYQSKYPNLMVYDRPHAGVSAAVEYGVLASRSEWLAFADSDDWLEADFLETLYVHVSRPDCDIVVANMVLHRPKGAVQHRCSSLASGFYEKSQFADKVYPGLICLAENANQYTVGVSRSSKLFQRKVVLKGLPYCVGLTYSEDKALVVSSVLHCNGIAILDGYYPYHYRLNYKPMDLSSLYQKAKNATRAIERITGDMGTHDFRNQIQAFRLSCLTCDVNYVVMAIKPWNKAALSKRLKEIYKQGHEDGVLPFDESRLDLHWKLVKHGYIWLLGGFKLVMVLRKKLKRCGSIMIKKNAVAAARACAPVRETA